MFLKSETDKKRLILPPNFTCSREPMNLMDAIKTGQNVRRYKPIPVPVNLLKEALNASRMRPSADNAQPWKSIAHAPMFVVPCGIRDEVPEKAPWKDLEELVVYDRYQ
jgi:hypothetical protein